VRSLPRNKLARSPHQPPVRQGTKASKHKDTAKDCANHVSGCQCRAGCRHAIKPTRRSLGSPLGQGPSIIHSRWGRTTRPIVSLMLLTCSHHTARHILDDLVGGCLVGRIEQETAVNPAKNWRIVR